MGRQTNLDQEVAHKCLNCGERATGAHCASCGQTTNTKRLRTADLLRDAVSGLFDYDAKVPATVLGLMRDPGGVCVAYVEGKRIRFVQPFRYFLIIIAISIFLNIIVGVEPTVPIDVELTPMQLEIQQQVTTFVSRHLSAVLIAAIPIFILVMRLLFYRAGRNYAETGVFVLFVVAQVALLQLPLVLLKSSHPTLFVFFGMSLHLAFFCWASVKFFGSSLAVSLVKNVLSTIAFVLTIGFVLVLYLLPTILNR